MSMHPSLYTNYNTIILFNYFVLTPNDAPTQNYGCCDTPTPGLIDADLLDFYHILNAPIITMHHCTMSVVVVHVSLKCQLDFTASIRLYPAPNGRPTCTVSAVYPRPSLLCRPPILCVL